MRSSINGCGRVVSWLSIGVMDLARGLVLHVTCGTAVVLLAVVMGRQRKDPPEFGQSVAVQSS